MTGRRTGAVVKLGGSVVTDKAAKELRVRETVVRRLVQEIVESKVRPLVLIHGAGSFGHQIVKRTGIHLGFRGDSSRLDLGETQRLQYLLDAEITRICLEEGLPVMPCQASASAVLRDGRLESMDTLALDELIGQGMIPLLYGVPAVDVIRGCAILSGDQIAPYVATRLGFERLIHGTDVDGVFESDPTNNPEAHRFARVDQQNWDDVRRRLRGSRSVDVTGGMEGKVSSLIDLARDGLQSRIIDATIPGRLAAALAGERVGTLVCWEDTE